MIKIFLLLSSLLIFSNNVSIDDTAIMDWSFRNNDSFEVESSYIIYILRSRKDKITSNKVDFTITSKAKISKFSYYFSNLYFNTTEDIEKNLKKANHNKSKDIYTFQVENDKTTSYFYLAIELESYPTESAYVKISLNYPSSDSSSFSIKEIIMIIIFVIIGICACGICIVVSASKGLCEGCDACCSFCGECCHCLEECCKCLEMCSK